MKIQYRTLNCLFRKIDGTMKNRHRRLRQRHNKNENLFRSRMAVSLLSLFFLIESSMTIVSAIGSNSQTGAVIDDQSLSSAAAATSVSIPFDAYNAQSTNKTVSRIISQDGSDSRSDDRSHQDDIPLEFSREFLDQLTTNNPCLVHYCPKGRECIIDTTTKRPSCICQRYCSHRKRPICGSDGQIYENHCELHRASCLQQRPITYQRFDKCPPKTDVKSPHDDKVRMMPATAGSPIMATTMTTTVDNRVMLPTSAVASKTTLSWRNAPDQLEERAGPLNSLGGTGRGAIMNDLKASSSRQDFCSSQEYEIMKDNLLLYSHARLMSQDNNHSKDFLVSIMFSHYDQNNNGHLEIEELNQVSIDEHLEELSNGCVLGDMLKFDDADHDGRLSINEFYQAFSKLYSVSVVSLDKALETNHLSARVDDNVEIKCDVTGSPSPQIIWQRNGIDLATLNENEIRVFSDGSLYLTRIQLLHDGNYTCHAQRNKDVVQTHILKVYTIPEVRVMPRIQTRRPGENAEMWCHVIGEPFPKVEWLKNDDRIDLNAKPNKYEILGNGTTLIVRNITYSDTGAYMCQATNIGGSVLDISSLIIQEEPIPTLILEERKFFVFHETGISVYEPAACHLYHQIHGTDVIPGTQEYVCGTKNTSCSWGKAINVGTRYIYISQPERDRVLVISTIQLVVVDSIATDKYPVELNYVPQLDQVWVLNWRYTENKDAKTIQVIRDVSQNRKHHSVHPEPIDGQFDLVKDLFIPLANLLQPHFNYRHGYVTHRNQRGMYKLDLANLRYTKSVDLTLYNCVPENVEFSALYGFVIISCREPVTNRAQGQLVLDYLSDTVLSVKPELNGRSRISPDSRHLTTIEHNANGVVIVIQKLTTSGLEFLFDVKTSLNLSDMTFYESQNMQGYDVFASTSDKEDILYINLFTGKVEVITGVGQAMPGTLAKWNNPIRPIEASGLFGLYMVTPANNALYVINGKSKTVNCQTAGILHPVSVIWVPSPMSSFTSSIGFASTNVDLTRNRRSGRVY